MKSNLLIAIAITGACFLTTSVSAQVIGGPPRAGNSNAGAAPTAPPTNTPVIETAASEKITPKAGSKEAKENAAEDANVKKAKEKSHKKSETAKAKATKEETSTSESKEKKEESPAPEAPASPQPSPQ